MPTRLLKESICTSETIDSLSAFHENFFYRLLVNCDDYGRMDARPRILKAALYPLKELRDEQIADALRKLASAELVILYEVGGKPFLQTTTWARHQQIRAKRSRYPAIPGPVDDMQAPEIICKQMISDENSGYQEQSNDNRCTRNPIQSNPVVVRTRDDDGFIDPEEAHAIQTGHDDVFDAAKRAGFTDSDAVRDKLIALIAEYSAPWVLDGIARAVDRGKPNIGYLSGILKRYKAGGGPDGGAMPAQEPELHAVESGGSVEDMMQRQEATAAWARDMMRQLAAKKEQHA